MSSSVNLMNINDCECGSPLKTCYESACTGDLNRLFLIVILSLMTVVTSGQPLVEMLPSVFPHPPTYRDHTHAYTWLVQDVRNRSIPPASTHRDPAYNTPPPPWHDTLTTIARGYGGGASPCLIQSDLTWCHGRHHRLTHPVFTEAMFHTHTHTGRFLRCGFINIFSFSSSSSSPSSSSFLLAALMRIPVRSLCHLLG